MNLNILNEIISRAQILSQYEIEVIKDSLNFGPI